MINKETITFLVKINKKAITTIAVLFLVVNIFMQYQFFNDMFLKIGGNADETSYRKIVNDNHQLTFDYISNTKAQPYTFATLLLNKFLNDARLSTRIISLASSIFLFTFLFYHYRKNYFTNLVSENKMLNNLLIFNVLFSVLYIISGQFAGTSDMISVAFALPGFILLTEVLLFKKNNNLLFIGLLFALSFTSRPTFLVVMLAYLLSMLFVFRKKIFSIKLLYIGLFFILFTGLINLNPILKNKEIVLDIKEMPKETGTTWFELNFLMAKKWDAGEIPNTQWLSANDVAKFKIENPNFTFPKNNFDIIINHTGLYFRQMIRMFTISMYSSFRYLYLLFPFLICYPFLKRKSDDVFSIKFTYFVLSFYFSCLLIFMTLALKLMEFRWMNIPVIFFAFFALHISKNLSENKRLILFNGTFVVGILFFILKTIKG